MVEDYKPKTENPKDLISKYMRDSAHPILSKEEEAAYGKDLEEKGNKLLWTIFQQDPSFFIRYMSTKDIPEEEMGKFFIDLTKKSNGSVVPRAKTKKAERKFYERLGGLRELRSFVGIYRRAYESYLENLDERIETAEFDDLDEAKVLKRNRSTIETSARKYCQSREGLVRNNLRLVVSIAKSERLGSANGARMELLDLIQEGNIGLHYAADGYDHKEGFRFSTYATWWIRQAITRAVADTGRIIRLPVHLVEKLNKIASAHTRLTMREGNREFSPEELTEEIARKKAEDHKDEEDWEDKYPITAEDIVKILDKTYPLRNPSSLESRVTNGDGEPSKLKDFIVDPKSEDAELASGDDNRDQRIREILSVLKPREQMIIQYRFGIDYGNFHPKSAYTLQEVGDILGVTRERVRQIEAKALAKLRHPSRRDYMIELLEDATES